MLLQDMDEFFNALEDTFDIGKASSDRPPAAIGDGDKKPRLGEGGPADASEFEVIFLKYGLLFLVQQKTSPRSRRDLELALARNMTLGFNTERA